MQIMDQFGAAPGAESVRMPDGTERTLAAEHAAAILVNDGCRRKRRERYEYLPVRRVQQYA